MPIRIFSNSLLQVKNHIEESYAEYADIQRNPRSSVLRNLRNAFSGRKLNCLFTNKLEYSLAFIDLLILRVDINGTDLRLSEFNVELGLINPVMS